MFTVPMECNYRRSLFHVDSNAPDRRGGNAEKLLKTVYFPVSTMLFRASLFLTRQHSWQDYKWQITATWFSLISTVHQHFLAHG